MLPRNRLVCTNGWLFIPSGERSSVVRKRGNPSDVCGTRTSRRQSIRKIVESIAIGIYWQFTAECPAFLFCNLYLLINFHIARDVKKKTLKYKSTLCNADCTSVCMKCILEMIYGNKFDNNNVTTIIYLHISNVVSRMILLLRSRDLLLLTIQGQYTVLSLMVQCSSNRSKDF